MRDKITNLESFNGMEQALKRGEMNKVKTMGQVIRKRRIFCVSPDDTAMVACRVLTRRKVGALPVVDDHGSLIGMISERDIVRRCLAEKKRPYATPVSELMTSDPIFANPNDSIVVGMAVMMQNHIRHLPVLENGSLIGTVSMREVTQEVTAMAMSNLGLMSMAGHMPVTAPEDQDA